MNNLTYDQMITKLNTNTCYVVFTKDDKSLASMICTLNHAVMPSTVVAYLNSGNLLQLIQSRLTVDTHHITAYNLEKGGWATFRVDSVHSFGSLT